MSGNLREKVLALVHDIPSLWRQGMHRTKLGLGKTYIGGRWRMVLGFMSLLVTLVVATRQQAQILTL